MTIETFIPTLKDKARLMSREGFLKVSGDRIFATRQGEGVTAGMPAVFLRLHFCNLICGKNSGWKCDTRYTWDNRTREFWQEPIDMTPSDIAKQVKQSWPEAFGETNKHRIVVTGGEPLLQQRKIVELIKLLPDWAVEIETNGTITPMAELSNCQFNCSPKLSNSGNKLNSRYRPDALKVIARLSNSWFKFVATGVEDIIEIQAMVDECGMPPERIFIMPEGQTAEAVSQHASSLESAVLKRGWKMTLRNQLIWYGDKRRT